VKKLLHYNTVPFTRVAICTATCPQYWIIHSDCKAKRSSAVSNHLFIYLENPQFHKNTIQRRTYTGKSRFNMKTARHQGSALRNSKNKQTFKN